mmetsp:Transcript_10431/g.22582  ORF Transcript_10431/g.22582 Transcript_10431/m.22582 type:complete len:283 (-) Transcript_10431:213-1061(-)
MHARITASSEAASPARSEGQRSAHVARWVAQSDKMIAGEDGWTENRTSASSMDGNSNLPSWAGGELELTEVHVSGNCARSAFSISSSLPLCATRFAFSYAMPTSQRAPSAASNVSSDAILPRKREESVSAVPTDQRATGDRSATEARRRRYMVSIAAQPGSNLPSSTFIHSFPLSALVTLRLPHSSATQCPTCLRDCFDASSFANRARRGSAISPISDTAAEADNPVIASAPAREATSRRRRTAASMPRPALAASLASAAAPHNRPRREVSSRTRLGSEMER